VAASLGLDFESTSPLDEAVGSLSSAPVIAEGVIESMRGASEKLVLNDCAVYLGEETSGSLAGSSGGAQVLTPVYKTNGIIVYYSDAGGPAGLTAGMRVRVVGTLKNWETPDNPGEFNVRRYYRTKGIDYGLYADKILAVAAAPSFNFAAFLDSVYSDIEALIDELADTTEEAGFEKAIILGDRSELSDELEMDFRISGISHVLAISGLHLSLMGMAIFNLLKKIGAPRFVAAIISDSILLFYVVMISGSASAWRAFIMFTLMLLAPLIGRSYDSLSALAVAGMLLIISEPMYLLDGGFQLSFAAIVGIGGVYPALKSLMPKHVKPLRAMTWRDKIVDRLVLLGHRSLQSLLFGLSIQLATLPVAAYQYYTVSPYGLVLNLLVVPLAGIMLGSYLLGTIIGSAYYAAGVFTAGTGHFIYKGLSFVSSFVAKLPGASLVIGRPALWQILLYYFLLFFGLLGVSRLSERSTRSRQGEIIGVLSKIKGSLTKSFGSVANDALSEKSGPWGRNCKYVSCIIFALILLLPFILVRRPASELTITNLSVGQGDCAVIANSGRTMLIDCGSSSRSKAGSQVILPFLKSSGISHIDLIALTHSDTDHVSAFSDILSDPAISVSALAIPLATARDSNWEAVLSTADLAGLSLFYLYAGDSFELGDAEISVLYPSATTELEEGNDTSLVLSLRAAYFSALFAGDISSEVEEQLCVALDSLQLASQLSSAPTAFSLETFATSAGQSYLATPITTAGQVSSASSDRQDSSLMHYDYLKVAHHGSKNSSSSTFLEFICPKVSVISVGRGNMYGHPHVNTLDRLTAAQSSIFRTDNDGAVTVTATPGGIFVSGFK